LAGERVLVTSGPTREPIDPVRYLSNRSSGKMGHAVAAAALRRGAEVVLISGPTALKPPAGAVFVPVQTAEEMREAALQHLAAASVVIKAAAVADYRVERPSPTKIKSGGKRDGMSLDLVPNPDILKELAQKKSGAFLVGFAAETGDLRTHAADKLRAKGVDLLVANDVSQQGIGFEADDNQVTLLDRWGGALELPRMNKIQVAHAILDRVLALRATPKQRRTPSR
jgi:phosphopantothenoylcysteine decarboxylase / phosphopantothenate---cysteine ligase